VNGLKDSAPGRVIRALAAMAGRVVDKFN